MLEVAATVIHRAEQNYLTYLQKFGTGQMWLDAAGPAELFIEDMPPWFARD
jgi:hypothetical protein